MKKFILGFMKNAVLVGIGVLLYSATKKKIEELKKGIAEELVESLGNQDIEKNPRHIESHIGLFNPKTLI